MRHRTGRQSLKIALGVAWGLMGIAGGVEAVSGDADGTYTITITTIEVSKDGGANYTTLFSGSQLVNIASAAAGAAVSGLVSHAGLEEGTYNTVRVTIGATLQLKGFVNFGTTTIYTNNDADGFGDNGGGGANSPGSDYAASTFTIPVASRTQTFTGLSLPVDSDNPRTCVVSFDTAGVITQSGGTPSVGSPSVSITSR